MLGNLVDFEGLSVLDLFSGTGHISLEFASRGANRVTAVDAHARCAGFLRDISNQLELEVTTVKEDVFRFLKQAQNSYDLIFADPPYDLTNIPEIHELVFGNDILKDAGLLIIEHGPRTELSELSHFLRERKYGNVRFSFFRR